MTEEELDTLARTLWGEARGELLIGIVAVAWCILNRVNIDLNNDNKPDWWGEGIIGVCKKPQQFSCWNTDDKNYNKILSVTQDDQSFKTCYLIAQQVLSGLWPDPTNGATHYHTIQSSPYWSKGVKPLVTIGNHVFYRLTA